MLHVAGKAIPATSGHYVDPRTTDDLIVAEISSILQIFTYAAVQSTKPNSKYLALEIIFTVYAFVVLLTHHVFLFEFVSSPL
jgi:hypothetical protein